MSLSPPSPRISSLIHLLCLLFLSTLHAQTPTWVRKSPPNQPEPRQHHTLTYDSARRQIVLAGVSYFSSPPSGLIWIWDGSNWSKPELSSLPAPWLQHAAAFDEARSETVIFGGSTSAGLTNQTLIWDGTTLTQRNPPASPSPRAFSAMAYDAERNQIVLFGGGDAYHGLSDTWVWDGLKWQLKSPVNSPAARIGHAMTWDPVRKVVLLYGGRISGPNELASDIWAWNGTDWSQYAPAVTPPPRAMHAMAYVASLDRAIVFGGGYPYGVTPLSDTWSWDGANWAQITSPPHPPARQNTPLAYDSSRQEFLLFGGFDGYGLLNDTWIGSAAPPVQGFFTLSPPSLALSASLPGTSPAIPPITVTAPYQAPFSVSTSTADGRSWLRASPPSSTTPSTIQVSIDPSELARGTYSGSVSISAPSLGVPTQSIPVSLTLDRSSFTINPASSSLEIVKSSQTTASTSVDLTTTFSGQAAFTAESWSPWLSISPSSGVSPARLSLIADATGLAEGIHYGTVIVRDPNNDGLLPAYYNLTLRVYSQPPVPPPPPGPPPLTIAAQPSSINLYAWSADGPRTVTLNVSPSVPLTPISASAKTAGGGSWLSVSPTSVLAAPFTQFTVTLDPSGLPGGLHTGSITFASDTVPISTLTVPVSLTVTSHKRILPGVAAGDGRFTTISLVNLESTPATFVLRFRDVVGSPLPLPLEGVAGLRDTFSSTIPARGLLTLRTRGSDPYWRGGWAELETEHNIHGLGVISRRFPTENDQDAAVPIQSPSTAPLALLFDDEWLTITDFALINPSYNATSITAEAFDFDGSPLGSSTINLDARRSASIFLHDRAPVPLHSQGLILLKSESVPIAGLGLRYSPLIPSRPFTSVPLLTPLPNPADSLVIPHFAAGGEHSVWLTRVAILNHSTAAVRARVSFFGPDGSPQPLPFLLGGDPSTEAEITIFGRSPLFLTTNGLPGPLRQGWLKITSSDPTAQLSALAVFRGTAEGEPTYEAAAAAAPPGRQFVLPFDNTAGSATALAVVNTMESSAAPITLTARDQFGAVIGSASLDLAASGHTAFRLLDHLPITAARRGTIELESAAEISSLGLQFNPSGTFTSVPAIARPPGL